MKRRIGWRIALMIVAAFGLLLFAPLRPSKRLLNDNDTWQIIAEINRQHDPLRWFHHDWPLGNHFYRPLVAELFELENVWHPHDDYAWGLTCDFLAFLTTLGLFWFLREITENIAVSTASALLFIVWQFYGWNQYGWVLELPCFLLSAGALIFGAVRQIRAPQSDQVSSLAARVGKGLAIAAPPALIWYWLARSEVAGFRPLAFRMLEWIPGRTASMMTVFAFLSLGAFARYMRLLPRRPLPATPLDRPNTRSADPVATKAPSEFWPVLAMVGMALSLLCYEQAVMIPVLLAMTGFYWQYRGASGRRWWWWAVPAASVLAGYLLARHEFIPHTVSYYYNAQRRTMGTGLVALQAYLFYFWDPLYRFCAFVAQSPGRLLITFAPWLLLLDTAAAITSLWQIRRRWLLAGFAWLCSVVAYSPMAWFREFEHYHYWSMAFRAFFDVMMAWIALDLTISAVSPQGMQAPQRRVPAPGSLLHPCSSTPTS